MSHETGHITGWSEWSPCPISCSTPTQSSGIVRRTAICDGECEIEEVIECHPPGQQVHILASDIISISDNQT